MDTMGAAEPQQQQQQKWNDQLENLRTELLSVIEPNKTTKGMPFFLDDSTFTRTLHQFVVVNAVVTLLQEDEEEGKERDNDNEDEQIRNTTSVEQLLTKPMLLEDMVFADGASGGNYGKAYTIYQEIQTVMDVDQNKLHPVLHRLAVAIALVHATPIVQTNPRTGHDDDDDHYVDPVRRYLNYEDAFVSGHLDPNFPKLQIWELKYVVDGDEPDEISKWGRDTLKNYYPEHVYGSCSNNTNTTNTTDNNKFLYAGIVRTDIPYGSSRVSQDLDTNQKYQNILMNGGICGRRAFFGRFILRAFGIPTTARPSKGHAALCHASPEGDDWVINLGNRWGKGWTKTQYVKDLDFLAMTQARSLRQHDYKNVKTAQFIGDVYNEKPIYGVYDPKVKGRGQNIEIDLNDPNIVGYWYARSLTIQKAMLAGIQKNPAVRKRSYGAPTGGQAAATNSIANCAVSLMKTKQQSKSYMIVKNDTTTTIIIPAGSYTDPKRTKDVKVMKSFIMTESKDDSHNGTGGGGGDNVQIYLSHFSPEGTTILRGGTWKEDALNGHCNSGSRLLSDGKGHYEDWGFRVAMTMENEEDDSDSSESNHNYPSSSSSCPEPTITLSLSHDDDNDKTDDSSIVTIDFVYIPPGTFVMGGTKKDDGRFSCVEVPHHKVRITKGFYLGKFPVTQQQYQLMFNGKNPSKSTKNATCPVDNISVTDALLFCELVSDRTGCNVRLPSEAEWEYAARGNTNTNNAKISPSSATNTKWFWGNDPSKLGDYAWYKDNANGKSHCVGLKQPNPFGLYDLYGNVCERVNDTYKREYYEECHGASSSSQQNNDSPDSGGWCDDPKGPSQGVKSKFRYANIPVPSSGTYSLTAKVCTVTNNQRLNVSLSPYNASAASGDDEIFVMNLPYTIGEWQESDPVILYNLKKGNDTTLYFWRDNPPQYGVSIKQFTLTKVE